jgi:hypothetical protein
MGTNEHAGDDLLRRAYAAWFRYGGTDIPDSSSSRVEKHGGLRYVVLRKKVNGVLACYRVRNNGQLKMLVRLPRALESERGRR